MSREDTPADRLDLQVAALQCPGPAPEVPFGAAGSAAPLGCLSAASSRPAGACRMCSVDSPESLDYM